MDVPPRPKERPILPRRLTVWLVIIGLVMAGGSLGVLSWASGQYGDVVARTMAVTTFAFFRLFSSLETADEERSLFSGYLLDNPPLLKASAISVVAIVLATELGLLQRFLGMVNLTGDQWLVCVVVALSIVVIEEIKKLLKVRTVDEPAAAPITATAPAG